MKSYFALIATAPLLAMSTFAQTPIEPTATNTAPIILDEIIVSGSPLGHTLFEQAQAISVLSGPKLQQQLQPTLGETLSNTPGVRSTYFGPAASRPEVGPWMPIASASCRMA